MTALIPESKSRLLLVEGKEDQEFFIQLGSREFPQELFPQILQYGGKDNLGNYLRGLMRLRNFKQISHIGIVRDADYGTDAFQGVRSALEYANRRNAQQLPIPQSPIQPAGESPKVSVLILPTDAEGMLEDLVLDALKEDTVMRCVDDFFICLADRERVFVRERLSKARVRVFIIGKNMDAQATVGDDADKRYLSDIFHMSWWREELWEHESFNDAKAFLQWLAAD